MITLLEVQIVMEKIFNKNILPMHYEFWKTSTNEELLNTQFLNLPLFSTDSKKVSNLILELKRIKDNAKINDSDLNLAPYVKANYIISEDDIKLIENWVKQFNSSLKLESFQKDNKVYDNISSENLNSVDETHVKYWREIDVFFLPSLASNDTVPHVIKMHANALQQWIPSNLFDQNASIWTDFLSKLDTIQSFEFIRLHQRRIITQHYSDSQELIFDSLWKFGGDLLPIDPLSQALPKHRMNGVLDWMYWIPYLDASLRANDINEIDLNLARGWQIGLIADGLLRTDSERPNNNRMPINDFSAEDPNLKENVIAAVKNYDSQDLISKMILRAKEAKEAGGIFPF